MILCFLTAHNSKIIHISLHGHALVTIQALKRW